MRAWLWTILLISLAVVLAVVIHNYPGNVLIVVDQWRIQVSLALAIVATVAAFVVFYYGVRLLNWMTQLPDRYRGWKLERRERRDQSQLELGWSALLEGRYAHAEKVLTRLSADSADARRRVLAQLSAARAAHELGEKARRDELIESARSGASGLTGDTSMSTAVAVAAADLWLDDGQAQRALDVLQKVGADPQKHVHLMRLLLRAYEALGLHDKVLETARLLRRKDALSASQIRDYVERNAAAQLRQVQGSAQWQTFWKSLKSEEKLYPEVALAGSVGLLALAETRESARVLEQAIKESFDGRLLAAYARTDADQVNARIQKAESWLEKRPDDPDLLTALGALCLTGQMWGQAQRYLEQSSKLRSDARVHALLGSLYDRIGKSQQAAKHWRLATAVSAALPVLAQDVHLPAADIAADPQIHHTEGFIEDRSEDQASVVVTGDSIAAADVLYRASDPSTEPVRTQASSSQVNDDYHEFFDSAPIPFDGSPALPTSRSVETELNQEHSQVGVQATSADQQTSATAKSRE